MFRFTFIAAIVIGTLAASAPAVDGLKKGGDEVALLKGGDELKKGDTDGLKKGEGEVALKKGDTDGLKKGGDEVIA